MATCLVQIWKHIELEFYLNFALEEERKAWDKAVVLFYKRKREIGIFFGSGTSYTLEEYFLKAET